MNPNAIKIHTNRVRTEFDEKKIEQLSESIRLLGLINPIVIDDDNFLIAGERRLRAVKLLGWSDVDVRFFNDISDWEKLVMELEENIQREDITPTNEVLAKKRFHDLYQDKYGKTHKLGGRKGGWKLEDTAQLLGISVGKLSQDIQLAVAIEKNPDLGKEKTKAGAWNAFKRQQATVGHKIMALIARKKQQELVIHTDATGGTICAGTDKTGLLHKVEQYNYGTGILYNHDCLEIIPELPNDSINCLLTDPPWAVLFDEQFMEAPRGQIFSLIEKTLVSLYPKLINGSLCWMFCATKHLIKGHIYTLVEHSGYRIFDQILIWYKPRVAHSSRPYNELKNDYEPCLLFAKGEPRTFKDPMYAVQEALIKGRRLHPAQKPIEVLRTIITNSTVENETIIDPFCGSGQVLKAAKELNRRSIGCELGKDWYDVAITQVC